MSRAKFFFAAAFLPAFLFSAAAAGAEETAITGTVVVQSQDGKIVSPANVVVFIDKLETDKGFEPPAAHPEIRQRGKKFVPDILPVVTGTTVDFVNDDNLFHNVFSRSKARPFDLGIYKQGLRKSLTFDTPGLVKVYCNIHFNMVTFILVLNNPYFAVTSGKGEYRITGVPPGRYTLRAWQRFGEEGSREITVPPEQGTSADFQLVQDKTSLRHKNKYGREYSLHPGNY